MSSSSSSSSSLTSDVAQTFDARIDQTMGSGYSMSILFVLDESNNTGSIDAKCTLKLDSVAGVVIGSGAQSTDTEVKSAHDAYLECLRTRGVNALLELSRLERKTADAAFLAKKRAELL